MSRRGCAVSVGLDGVDLELLVFRHAILCMGQSFLWHSALQYHMDLHAAQCLSPALLQAVLAQACFEFIVDS